MSNRPRARITTSHAFTEEAREFCDYARLIPGVTAVSPGIIAKVSSNGLRHVKITDETAAIVLAIKARSTIQLVRIYSKPEERQAVKETLARFVRNNNYSLRFK